MSILLPRTKAVVLDRWQVVYVITPKAMCTSLLWAMARLQGERLSDVACSRSSEVTRALAAHDPATWRRTTLLHELPPERIEQVTVHDAWFRFCLTRHPVDRLWSAWQSKLVLREPPYAARFGAAPWFPRMPAALHRRGAALDALAEDFERFVVALTEDPQLLTADQHWAPQEHLLRTDAFPYTEIGRVEEAAETLGRLEHHLRAQGWQGTLDLTRRNASLLPRKAALRDPALLRRIEDLYAADMTAFGYKPATVGRRVPAAATAVAVHALAELADRHERIGDLHRLLARAPRRRAVSGREPRAQEAATSVPDPGSRATSPSRSRPAVSLVLLSGPGIPDGPIPDNVEAVIVPSGKCLSAMTVPATGSARVIPAPSAPGAAAQFQAGVAATTGDVVVFCRNVVALTPGWPERVRQALDDRDVGLVSALVQPMREPTLRLAGVEFVDELLNCRWRTETVDERCIDGTGIEVPLLSSTFLAVRRTTLAQLGGLDTGMRGDSWHDVELSVRGWRCELASLVLPDVVAVWRPPASDEPNRDFVHDLLRLAAVHLGEERFARLVAALRASAVLAPALADLLISDVGGRRTRMQMIALRDVGPLLPGPANAGQLRDDVAS